MSLQPSSPAEVPSQTAAVARAAFPRGNPCLRLRDELGTVFTEAQFTALFSARGRPAEAPWRLALVTVLQFAENLSDRRAAEAARGRIDWTYLLSLDLTDPASTPRCCASSAPASWPATPRRSCSTRSWLSAASVGFWWREAVSAPTARTSWGPYAASTASVVRVALNIGRIADWLSGETIAETRRSLFARLISQAA